MTISQSNQSNGVIQFTGRANYRAFVPALDGCGACANWSVHGDDRMVGYGGCKHRSGGHYTHASSACLLRPTRWRAA